MKLGRQGASCCTFESERAGYADVVIAFNPRGGSGFGLVHTFREFTEDEKETGVVDFENTRRGGLVAIVIHP